MKSRIPAAWYTVAPFFACAGLAFWIAEARAEDKVATNAPARARADEPAAAPRVDLYGDPLPDDAIARMGTVRFNHGCDVLAFAYRGDGREIVSLAADRTLCVWDASEGRLLKRTPIEIPGGVRGTKPLRRVGFALSADGRRAALSTHGGMIRLYDVASGEPEIDVQTAETAPARHLNFLGDGGRLLGVWQTARVFETTTGETLCELQANGYAATAPAAGLAAMSLRTNRVRVVDASTGDILSDLGPFPEAKHVSAVAFSGDAARLAVALTDARSPNAAPAQRSLVRIYQIATKAMVCEIERTGPAIKQLFFSPAGDRLVLATVDKTSIHNTVDGRELAALRPRPHRQVTCFCSDGAVISGLAGTTIAQWNARTGVELRPTHFADAHSAAFAVDGTRLATAGGDTLRVWDAATGRQLVAAEGHNVVHGALCFAPDGGLIFAGHHDRVVVLDATTLAFNSAKELPERLNCLAMSRDGRKLAAGGERTVYVIDCRSGQSIAEWCPAFPPVPERVRGASQQDFDPFINAVRFSPDGRRLLAQGASKDHSGMLMFDVTACRPCDGWCRPFASSVAFSEDSAKLIIANGRCEIVNAATGHKVSSLREPSLAITSAEFLENMELLLTAGIELDGDRDPWSPSLQVWDVPRRRIIARRAIRDTTSSCFVLSRDRSSLAAPRTDGTTVIFQLPEVARGSFGPPAPAR